MNSLAIVSYAEESTIPSNNPNNYPDVEISEFILSSQSQGKNHVSLKSRTLGSALNQVLDSGRFDYVLFIDDSKNKIAVKQSTIPLLLLTAQRHKNIGLIYTDYDIKNGDFLEEIHLLHHHPGRIRDNQDIGKLYFMSVDALEMIGKFDDSLAFNTLYDARLKLSEKHEIIHLSNRYSGSLYTMHATKSSTNVFDYLLASKDAQKEAEAVVTDHLKRIGAYLAPGQGYLTRPESDSNKLIASIIIPVNNRPEFIGTAIESVQKQTITDVEIIVVVNGGPKDTTIPEVKKYQSGGALFNEDLPLVHLIVMDINNIGFCLNAGTVAAKGNYYVQLDSDDRLKPDAVEKIVQVYGSDNHIGMVIGSYEVWEKKENGKLVRMEDIPVITHDEWTEENGRNNLLRINGAGAPRSIPIQVIKDIGFFSMNDDPYARNYGEDYDMVLRISEKFKIGRIWEPIYEVIRHSGGTDHAIDQVTVDRNDNAKDHMRKETINRRQRMNGRLNG